MLPVIRFCGSQDVLGVLDGRRRALRVLGSSLGRFWDLVGRPGRFPGRRPMITFRRRKRYKYLEVLELGRFSVTCGGVWIFFVFSLFLSSVVFVEWGGEFVVK